MTDLRSAPGTGLPALAGAGRGLRRLRQTRPPHRRQLDPQPRRCRAARTRPGPCSPRAGTAAPRSARPARTATPPTPSTCSAPASPGTTPRTCPPPWPSTRGCSSPSPRPPSGRCTPAPSPARGHVVPCRCGERHHGDDPRLGTAARPRPLRLRRGRAVAGPRRALWHRFTTTLRRDLAAALGVPGRRFREHARLSYAKVAEYQRRGLVHFHAVIRLDGPDGPTDPPPAGLDRDALRHGRSAPLPARPRHHRPTRRQPAAVRLGHPARPAPGHPDRRGPARGRHRADHRRRAGRLHRQVRHQDHRHHRRDPTGPSATATTSTTSTSPTTTGA